MPEYTYHNQNITIDILMKVEQIVRILSERFGKSFDEMLGIFYASKTYQALKNTESSRLMSYNMHMQSSMLTIREPVKSSL